MSSTAGAYPQLENVLHSANTRYLESCVGCDQIQSEIKGKQDEDKIPNLSMNIEGLIRNGLYCKSKTSEQNRTNYRI